LVDAYYEFLSDLWTAIWEASPDLEPVREQRIKPGELRVDKRSGGGGSAIGRPIGQLVVAEVLMRAMNENREPREFLQSLFAEVSFNLDDTPWRKLLWNPQTRSIQSGKTLRTLTVQLILHKFGLRIPITAKQLRERYRETAQDNTLKLLRVGGGTRGLAGTGDGHDDQDDPDESDEAEA